MNDMERREAYNRLRQLIGQDLRPLADKYAITVTKDGKLNKGWAGQTIERHLGLALNSSRAPNFGSWELKLVSVRRNRKDVVTTKETIAVTMIDPVEVMAKTFLESHLYNKMRKKLVVSRFAEADNDTQSLVHNVAEFDLNNSLIFNQVQSDYELIRSTIRDKGFGALSGRMGVYVQPRPKGPGHGSESRAFYIRSVLVAHILNIKLLPGVPVVAPLPSEE